MDAGADGRARQVQVGAVDQIRLDNVLLVNAGVTKDFVASRLHFQIHGDAFNVLNRQTVLQRVNNLSDPSRGAATEVMGPCVFRVGIGVKF